MQFDFVAILALAALITGLIWAADALWWSKSRARRAGEGEAPREPAIVEYSKSLFPIIVIVLVLRAFVVEPFRIPSGSMMPTLRQGDFILVSKFAYGIRLPVVNKKIIDLGDPERGDVVVFRYPKQPSLDYIKRIVGLPGDRIAYRDKRLFVNGKPLDYEPLGIYTGTGTAMSMTGARMFREHIGEAKHEVLVDNPGATPAYPCLHGTYTVPEGEYFAMGDNRDRSNDSRFWCGVPDENLVGKAFMIWMNWDTVDGGITWERIGDWIR